MFSETQETFDWCAKQFGISTDDIEWYHCGICYDRICVKTKQAADAVSAVCVKENRKANGGFFHDMPLGAQSKINRQDGTIVYDITC